MACLGVPSARHINLVSDRYQRFYEATKRAKLEEIVVSASEWGQKRTVHRQKMICDHRNFSGLHTTLHDQVEAFGKFCDLMRSDDKVNWKYYEVASKLMVEMNEEFKYEADRKAKFFEIIRVLDDSRLPKGENCRGKGHTDGCVSVNYQGNKHYLANWEYKNEMVEISSEPFFENEACFVHLQKGETGRNPMLLLNVVGCHYIQVFGAAWNGVVVLIHYVLHCPYCLCLGTLLVVLIRWLVCCLPIILHYLSFRSLLRTPQCP